MKSSSPGFPLLESARDFALNLLTCRKSVQILFLQDLVPMVCVSRNSQVLLTANDSVSPLLEVAFTGYRIPEWQFFLSAF